MNKTNPKVNWYFKKENLPAGKAGRWQKEMIKLRSIILDSELTEELKWGQPTYTFQENNVILIHGFKEYCAIMFFKGVLLKDAKHVLIQQTENVQATRQIRFTDISEIIKLESIIKKYIKEIYQGSH